MYFKAVGCVIYLLASDTAHNINNVFITKEAKQNKNAFLLVSKACTARVFKMQTMVEYNNVINNPPYLNRFLNLPYPIQNHKIFS